MRPDELELLRAASRGELVRDAGRRLGVPDWRVLDVCRKWAAAGLYEYATDADLGRLTHAGYAIARGEGIRVDRVG